MKFNLNSCVNESFLENQRFAEVRDEVEESLVKESDNVRLWQMRIKTAMEQVGHTVVRYPQPQSYFTITSKKLII